MLWTIFRDEAVAQSTDAGDLDLDDVAVLQIRRRAVGAHPDHVARPQRKIFRQFDDERHDAEDHVVGLEAVGFFAVYLDDGLHLVEIGRGFDPGSHWLESVGILGPPQRAVGLLPGALADIVADGVAEHASHRVGLREMLDLLADDDDELAFVMDLFGRGRRDHHVLVMRDQRILGAIADFGPVRDVRHFAAFVGGFLEMLQIVQPDAIKRARHQRQFDLDVIKRMHLRRALPLAEGFAVDGDHMIAVDDAPGGPARGREFEPTHRSSLFFTRPRLAAEVSRRRRLDAASPDFHAASCRYNPCGTNRGAATPARYA